ncbi:MAG TPA: hypothetical protein VGT05_04525 [Patescibacteria group bacterium]|nr:hypothetical protein [Patescibacteria group bacterium]
MAKKEEQIKKNEQQKVSTAEQPSQQRLIGVLADEIAKTLVQRLPGMIPHPRKTAKKKEQKIDNGYFLDTSAIIDGRIFDVIELGVLWGSLVIPESILSELKHIADSQDMVKRERGQRGLASLEKVKKVKYIKFLFLSKTVMNHTKDMLVDDQLIQLAKKFKGRIITCDYNLEKKASISGVVAINVHELANRLKVIAVPGETLHIALQHVGKDPTQGVGYLADGTMIVVEYAAAEVGKSINVVITRVIATSSGRILFAKKV